MGSYSLAVTASELDALYADCLDAGPFVGADSETTGFSRWHDTLVGISLGPAWGRASYIPLAHECGGNAEPVLVARMLAALIENGRRFVFHNAPFDVAFWARFLNEHGHQIAPGDIGVAHDTQQLAYCLGQRAEAGKSTAGGLKPLAKRFLNVDRPTFEDLFPPKTKARDKRFAKLDLDIALPYAAADADDPLGLVVVMEPMLDQAGVRSTYELEMRVQPELLWSEWRGVLVDADLARASAKRCEEFASRAEERIKARLTERLGRDLNEGIKKGFNLNSNDQLRDLLFSPAPLGLGLPVLKRTPPSTRYPEGNPSTDESVLERLQVHEPALAWLLQMRGALKAKGTYFDTFEGYTVVEPTWPGPEADADHDFVVDLPILHPNYKQFGAETGRMSSDEPNVQNLPKKQTFGLTKDDQPMIPGVDPVSVNTRDMLVPRPGFYLMDADWCQIEYIAIGGYSQDPGLLETFRLGRDLHKATASLMFGVAYEDVTPAQRKPAKTMNYALNFGAGDDRVALMMACPKEEAKILRQRWEMAFPHVAVWKTGVEDFAKRHKYVETLFGRKRWLDFGGQGVSDKAARAAWFAALREAVNTPIQGTCADLFKITTLRLNPWLREHFPEVRVLLYTHDSWTMEVPDTIDPVWFREIVRPVIEWPEGTLPGWPAIKADFVWGDRWGAMTEDKDEIPDEATELADVIDLPVQLQPETTSVMVVLKVPDPVTHEQARQLSQIIATMPGGNTLRLICPNDGAGKDGVGELEIPNVGLGPDDAKLIAHIFPTFTYGLPDPGTITAIGGLT